MKNVRQPFSKDRRIPHRVILLSPRSLVAKRRHHGRSLRMSFEKVASLIYSYIRKYS